MKVLVVDDDVVSRMVLMHLIDSEGPVEVAEAEDGVDAWDQLAGGASASLPLKRARYWRTWPASKGLMM